MPSSVKKTTRIRSVTSPAKKSPMRSTKRKQWSEQSMLAAIKATHLQENMVFPEQHCRIGYLEKSNMEQSLDQHLT